MEVEQFYDKFSVRQANAGVHRRHVAIFQWLKRLGMLPYHNVLEIGCGIGAVTGLVLNYIKRGMVVANDISGSSIDIAHKRLAKFRNVTFIKGDYLSLEIEGPFDVIFLPDVLEHIPLVNHKVLFRKLAAVLNENGFILIHIPEPHYLAWETDRDKSSLQVIDQPVYLSELVGNLEGSGLNVEFLRNYSIWNEAADYQVIQLKRRNISVDFTRHLKIKSSFLAKLWYKVMKIFGVERKIIPL